MKNRTAAILLALAMAGCAGKTSDKDSDKTASTSSKADERSSKPGPSAPRKGALVNEAKTNIGMLTKGAVAAYERETMVPGNDGDPPTFAPQALCKTAKPLGAKVPEGGESLEITEKDLEDGEDTGWKCLRFSPSKSVSFQYTYTLGSTPKHAARGSDIGKGDPNVFEICAEADFVPGGKTTLLCQSGTVITESKQVRLASQLFIADDGD